MVTVKPGDLSPGDLPTNHRSGDSEMSAQRCMAQALTPGGCWKTCIRESGHRDERHVWLESFDRVGGRPIVVTWTGARDAEPLVSEVLLSPTTPKAAQVVADDDEAMTGWTLLCHGNPTGEEYDTINQALIEVIDHLRACPRDAYPAVHISTVQWVPAPGPVDGWAALSHELRPRGVTR